MGEAGGAGKAKRHPSPVQSKVAHLRLEPGVREVTLLCSPSLLWTQSFLGIFSSRWFPWVTVKCRHTSLPLSWEVGAQGQSAPPDGDSGPSCSCSCLALSPGVRETVTWPQSLSLKALSKAQETHWRSTNHLEADAFAFVFFSS